MMADSYSVISSELYLQSILDDAFFFKCSIYVWIVLIPATTLGALSSTNLNLSKSEIGHLSKKIEGIGEVILWQNKKILIAESCAHKMDRVGLFDFVMHPKHPRYLDCYSEQNLLIKLEGEERFSNYALSDGALVIELDK